MTAAGRASTALGDQQKAGRRPACRARLGTVGSRIGRD